MNAIAVSLNDAGLFQPREQQEQLPGALDEERLNGGFRLDVATTPKEANTLMLGVGVWLSSGPAALQRERS